MRPQLILPVLLSIAGCFTPQNIDAKAWMALEPGFTVEYQDRGKTSRFTYVGRADLGSIDPDVFSTGETGQDFFLLHPNSKTIVGRASFAGSQVTVSFPRWTPSVQGDQLVFVGLELLDDDLVRLGATEVTASGQGLTAKAPYESRNFVTGRVQAFQGAVDVKFDQNVPFPTKATGFGHAFERRSFEETMRPSMPSLPDLPAMQVQPSNWDGRMFPEASSFTFPLSEAHDDLKRLSSEYKDFAARPGTIMCRAEYRVAGSLMEEGSSHSWKIRLCASDGETGELTVFRNRIVLNQSQLEGTFMRGTHDRQPWESTPKALVPFDELARGVHALTQTSVGQWILVVDATIRNSEGLFFEADLVTFAQDAVVVSLLPKPGLNLPAFMFSGFDGKLLTIVAS